MLQMTVALTTNICSAEGCSPIDKNFEEHLVSKLLILNSHPFGIWFLLPRVCPPVLAIVAAQLGGSVRVHARLPVLAAAGRGGPRLAQGCFVVGYLLKPMRWNPVVVGPEKRQPLSSSVYMQLLETMCKLTRGSPITVALTKPLTEDNFHWLPRILLLCLGWFRSTPISITIPSCVRGVLLMIVSIGLMSTQLMRPVTELAVVSLWAVSGTSFSEMGTQNSLVLWIQLQVVLS